MEIRQYFNLVWRWLWLILLGAVVAGGTAFLVSRAQEPIYQATAVLLITEGDVAGGNDFTAFQLSERLAKSYIERLNNYEVLAEAIANVGVDLDPDDLREDFLQVKLLNNSQLIELSVEHPDPQTAAALANEIPTVFAKRNMAQQLQRFSSSKSNLETELSQIEAELAAAETALETARAGGETSQDTLDQLTNNVARLRDTHSQLLRSYEDIRIAEARSLNNLIIDEAARVPNEPVRPRILLNTVLATVVGAMLALGVVFLVEYLDDTIKDPDEIERAVGLSTLGIITRFGKWGAKQNHRSDALVMVNEPRSPVSEAYRQLRTNIQFVSVSRQLKTILVTSANAGEGKSTTAANLAVAMAQAGHKVILVDTDLRLSKVHELFHISGSRGLTDLLMSDGEDESFLQPGPVDNLRILPCGMQPPNPAELLGSQRMKDVTAWLTEQADYVILDGPPILAVTDSTLLAQFVDTCLLVAYSGSTRYEALAIAVNHLKAVEGHIAGVLLNGVHPRRNGHYAYYQDDYLKNAEPQTAGLKRFLTSVLSLIRIQ